MEVQLKRPPLLAEWLVRATTPLHLQDAVLGDLCEEFIDHSAAKRWYWQQALRSALHWVPASLGFLLLGYVLPLLMLDQLWATVLSAVPLKVDAIRALPMLLINLTMACLLAAIRRATPISILIASVVLLAMTPARLPFIYWLLFATLPALAAQWPAQKVKRS